MLDTLEQIYKQALERLQEAATGDELEAWRLDTLGRKGSVQLQTRRVGEMPPDQRPQFGRRVNELVFFIGTDTRCIVELPAATNWSCVNRTALPTPTPNLAKAAAFASTGNRTTVAFSSNNRS